MRNKVSFTKRLLYIILFIILLAGYQGYLTYRKVYTPISMQGKSEMYYLYVHTGMSMDQLADTLFKNKIINDSIGFLWLAKRKNLEKHINPGRYLLNMEMNSNDLVNMIRSGKQAPVKVVFHNIRTTAQLAGLVSEQIEADSVSITDLLNDQVLLSENGWDSRSIPGLFTPNPYEFFWNTSSDEFLKRMLQEYEIFWSGARESKAESVGLNKNEVSTLASIVDEETYRDDELPKIAGVYLNRLKKRYRLQADPTVRFAKGDFEMKRILKKDLKINSPYNTYKYYGLPPGPISIPSIAAIDAVLNPDSNDYLYFCAREDFSGYHNFAKTLKGHNRNAIKYRSALNRRKIYK